MRIDWDCIKAWFILLLPAIFIFIIIILNIAIMLNYGDKPITEVPYWVIWWTGGGK